MRGLASIGRRIGCLWDHDHVLAFESEFGDGFVSEQLGGNDHMGCALHREMAQAQVHPPAAQALARAGECVEVVDSHDHRTGAAQHRALHPWRVIHVIDLTRTVGLDDLPACARGVAQRTQQAARIPSDAAWVG